MPTIAQARRNAAAASPQGELANAVGLSLAELFRYLAQREESGQRDRLLDLQIQLAQQDLRQKGPAQVEATRENTTASKVARRERGSQESVESRTRETVSAETREEEEMRQLSLALEGQFDELAQQEVGLSNAYPLARQVQAAGGYAGLEESQKTQVALRLAKAVGDMAEQDFRRQKEQQKERQRIDPTSARTDEEIKQEVRNDIQRRFEQFSGTVAEANFDLVQRVIDQVKISKGDSILKEYINEAYPETPDEKGRLAGAQRLRDIEQLGELGYLRKILGKDAVPDDLIARATTVEERKLLDQILYGDTESIPKQTIKDAINLIDKGRDAFSVMEPDDLGTDPMATPWDRVEARRRKLKIVGPGFRGNVDSVDAGFFETYETAATRRAFENLLQKTSPEGIEQLRQIQQQQEEAPTTPPQSRPRNQTSTSPSSSPAPAGSPTQGPGIFSRFGGNVEELLGMVTPQQGYQPPPQAIQEGPGWTGQGPAGLEAMLAMQVPEIGLSEAFPGFPPQAPLQGPDLAPLQGPGLPPRSAPTDPMDGLDVGQPSMVPGPILPTQPPAQGPNALQRERGDRYALALNEIALWEQKNEEIVKERASARRPGDLQQSRLPTEDDYRVARIAREAGVALPPDLEDMMTTWPPPAAGAPGGEPGLSEPYQDRDAYQSGMQDAFALLSALMMGGPQAAAQQANPGAPQPPAPPVPGPAEQGFGPPAPPYGFGPPDPPYGFGPPDPPYGFGPPDPRGPSGVYGYPAPGIDPRLLMLFPPPMPMGAF